MKPPTEFLDKNGRAIEPGQKVRPCQPLPYHDEPSEGTVYNLYGTLFIDFVSSCYSLSNYREGDTNNHSIEII